MNLKNKTIVVTRAHDQAAEFAAELKKFGADIFLFPTIEIVPPDSFAALDEAIKNLDRFDWLIFTAVNAVEYFLQRLKENHVEVDALDYLRVCAIGEATANRLASARIHLDVVPTDSKAEGVFAALREYIGEEFAGLRFLLPRAKVARDYLPEKLSRAGAEIEVAEAYQTILPRNPATAKLKALLAADSIEVITFTSGSTVKNFARIFAVNDLSKILAGVKIACLGDITAQAAAEVGLRTEILPAETTTFGLASAINDFFA